MSWLGSCSRGAATSAREFSLSPILFKRLFCCQHQLRELSLSSPRLHLSLFEVLVRCMERNVAIPVRISSLMEVIK